MLRAENGVAVANAPRLGKVPLARLRRPDRRRVGVAFEPRLEVIDLACFRAKATSCRNCI
jgi:hypothetical protein